MNAEELGVLATLIVPWAVVAVVAMLRGYNVRIWRVRYPDAGRAHNGRDTPTPDDDDDDEPP